MKNILFGNVDYRTHMTDEGEQFQLGLAAAGWTLCGAGFGDGLTDAVEILEREQPERVAVHDPRDWDPDSRICFRKDVGFGRMAEALRDWPGHKAIVVKDAGTGIEYQRDWAERIRAHTLITYYHPRACTESAPWMRDYDLVRTWHTVDGAGIRAIDVTRKRARGLVSGAVSQSYPLRQRIVLNPQAAGLDRLRHPGYSNRGSKTPEYLDTIARYKVHVCTASRFAFALRKIFESIAVGTSVVTDLPDWDILPAIDGALYRIRPEATIGDVREAVDRAEADWEFSNQMMWAARARAFYDYEHIGRRLSALLCGREVAV